MNAPQFLIVIPSYSCPDYIERSIRSAASQTVDAKIVIIDDASPDYHYPLQIESILRDLQAQEYSEGRAGKTRYAFLRQHENRGELHSIAHGIEFALNARWVDDMTVCVHLCGDDWFPHDNVLETLAGYYDSDDVWMTYGSYVYYPGGAIGHAMEYPKVVREQGSYRSFGWYASHLRSHRIWLWNEVPRIHWTDPETGKYFKLATDRAMMYPMLELAREHARFIPETLYVYNTENPLCAFKVHDDAPHAARVAAMTPLAALA